VCGTELFSGLGTVGLLQANRLTNEPGEVIPVSSEVLGLRPTDR
jgi:hypothetical protein